MKHFFYTHLIEINTINIEIDKLDLASHEKKDLQNLIEATVHHTILDIILSELSEDDKREFLSHTATNDHATIWYFLKRKTTDIEAKIIREVNNLIYKIHKDIQDTR